MICIAHPPSIVTGIAPRPPPERSNADEESTSSREPSYRYITVRENARVIRERLRQQGQLLTPAREHYYSVIGNEYETVSLLHTVRQLFYVIWQPALSVNLSMPRTQEFVPPPPTSPIPDRTPNGTGLEALEASRLSDTPHTDSENGDLYAVVSKPRVPASKSDGGLHFAVSRGSSSESHGGR
ncbi:unnamed protein product [Heligmosomoides polygyrus]|uniref:Uncharacterized protein n=1 Tax=Heligmosomoides polygyrus TaxID=6339 RepID=A0A3P7YT76_HELPZ|nr:unnamed protein product [Heligmosomoides polygyrus]